ncbi:hypothetical protein SAMN05216349_101228 [Oribacterium sp. KHPX15]|uniref:hypothetical protein n=1 Tax=Oribacterium sp. KHPX15 TaxID=1855342 RepID=UPI000894D103|nr:hypothetical protein [Oribacterium sp. KHPX15]SDZ82461.1 hypothetical protein SAMN05216349_101228 [Oribacterium sp. KHPX15]
MKYTRKMFLISAALTAAVSLSQAPLSLAEEAAGPSVSYNTETTDTSSSSASNGSETASGSDSVQAALEIMNESQRAAYYKTVADFYTSNGLDIPADIKAGLEQYSSFLSDQNTASEGTGSTTETFASSAGTGASASVNGTSVVCKTDEKGSTLLYKADPATGEAAELYNGWYEDSAGEKYYYEKGKLTVGWIIDDGKFYYFDPSTCTLTKSSYVGNFYVGEDGAALMDTVTPDGTKLAYNGSVYKSKEPAEKLNDLTYIYRNYLVEYPDLYAEFSERSSGSYQIMPEKENGFSWYTYASMKLYKRNANGSLGERVYVGDGCLRTDAVIEVVESDGSISTIRPSDLIGSGHEVWQADHIHIDPAGFITYTVAK